MSKKKKTGASKPKKKETTGDVSTPVDLAEKLKSYYPEAVNSETREMIERLKEGKTRTA